jgi:hypothetical protein
MAAGDLPGALADAEQGIRAAREIGDPLELQCARAFLVRALVAADRTADAGAALDELLDALRGDVIPPEVGADLPIALTALTGPGAADRLERLRIVETRWLAATRAWVSGDRVEAASWYAEIGSLPDQAAARAQAGADLLDAGRPVEARAQLDTALAFWREVGADGETARAEALLDRTRPARDGTDTGP